MKKFLTFLMVSLLSLTALIGFVGCNKDDKVDKPDTSANENDDNNVNVSITLADDNIELKEGESYVLSATIFPSDYAVVWSSSNENVAVVNSKGQITAISAGTTTVKAIVENKATAICIVTVTKQIQINRPATVTLSKTQVELDVGSTYLLSAIATPDNGEEIIWSSTNENIVTIKDGLLTGISSGTAFIRANVKNGEAAICTVEVKDVYGSISGTITCRNRRTQKDEVDVTTKIYLISYEADSVYLNNIMMSFEYNAPEKGVYQVSVNSSGEYNINNIKLGEYRMIIVCKGNDFCVGSDGSDRKRVLGQIYNKGSALDQERVVETTATYNAQMSGFDVTVGKNPLVITRTLYGVNEGISVK